MKKLAGSTRFELAASCVTGRRSNQAELRPHLHYFFLERVGKFRSRLARSEAGRSDPINHFQSAASLLLN